MTGYFHLLHTGSSMLTWHAPWCCLSRECERGWTGWVPTVARLDGRDLYFAGLGFELTVLR
jgi:hypothetical protein